MPDLIKTGYFESSEMKKVESCKFVMRYSCESRALLDEYLEHSADDLRRDFLDHFPEGVTLERRIYSDNA